VCVRVVSVCVVLCKASPTTSSCRRTSLPTRSMYARCTATGLMRASVPDLGGRLRRGMTSPSGSFTDQHLVFHGRLDGATRSLLSRCIPSTAALGGLCVGALCCAIAKPNTNNERNNSIWRYEGCRIEHQMV
jgi:hypothetical protein